MKAMNGVLEKVHEKITVNADNTIGYINQIN
jgi:hypothetical protein